MGAIARQRNMNRDHQSQRSSSLASLATSSALGKSSSLSGTRSPSLGKVCDRKEARASGSSRDTCQEFSGGGQLEALRRENVMLDEANYWMSPKGGMLGRCPIRNACDSWAKHQLSPVTKSAKLPSLLCDSLPELHETAYGRGRKARPPSRSSAERPPSRLSGQRIRDFRQTPP